MAKIIPLNLHQKNFIKNISEQLDCGQKAFIHKQTKQVIFIPDEEDSFYFEESFFEAELEEVKNNIDSYHLIEPMSSTESFEVMKNFAIECVDDKLLQSKLVNALQNRKPFQNFKFAIDNAGSYRQKWFDYKNEKYILYVEKKMSELELSQI